MSFLKCKICKSECFVVGEISSLETKIKCSKCNKEKKKDVIVEYRSRKK